MIIPFNTLKVVQASALLLRQHEGTISRLRLLKLLYIADRECLFESLRPITGDHPVAMDHGPVLSRTYDLIKSSDFDSALWDQYIQRRGPQNLELIDNPGIGKLSRYEIDKLQEVAERYRTHNDYDIAVETHEFEEWKRNQPARPRESRPIPLDDLLAALRLSGLAEQIRAATAADEELDALLRGATPD